MSPELADLVLEALRRSRVPLRNDDIQSSTGLGAAEVRTVLVHLMERGLVGRMGERRGTRYFLRN